jgi:cobalt-zinc-cadmium efflux system outer membrane protein
MRKVFFLVLLISSCFCFSQSQPNTSAIVPADSIHLVADTISITLNDAETFFLKNNYNLLAQKYGVDAQKALVRQAKLFNNPNIYFENSVYNPNKTTGSKFFPMANGTFGDIHNMGETVIQYNWLFSIAGKRKRVTFHFAI